MNDGAPDAANHFDNIEVEHTRLGENGDVAEEYIEDLGKQFDSLKSAIGGNMDHPDVQQALEKVVDALKGINKENYEARQTELQSRINAVVGIAQLQQDPMATSHSKLPKLQPSYDLLNRQPGIQPIPSAFKQPEMNMVKIDRALDGPRRKADIQDALAEIRQKREELHAASASGTMTRERKYAIADMHTQLNQTEALLRGENAEELLYQQFFAQLVTDGSDQSNHALTKEYLKNEHPHSLVELRAEVKKIENIAQSLGIEEMAAVLKTLGFGILPHEMNSPMFYNMIAHTIAQGKEDKLPLIETVLVQERLKDNHAKNTEGRAKREALLQKKFNDLQEELRDLMLEQDTPDREERMRKKTAEVDRASLNLQLQAGANRGLDQIVTRDTMHLLLLNHQTAREQKPVESDQALLHGALLVPRSQWSNELRIEVEYAEEKLRKAGKLEDFNATEKAILAGEDPEKIFAETVDDPKKLLPLSLKMQLESAKKTGGLKFEKAEPRDIVDFEGHSEGYVDGTVSISRVQGWGASQEFRTMHTPWGAQQHVILGEGVEQYIAEMQQKNPNSVPVLLRVPPVAKVSRGTAMANPIGSLHGDGGPREVTVYRIHKQEECILTKADIGFAARLMTPGGRGIGLVTENGAETFHEKSFQAAEHDRDQVDASLRHLPAMTKLEQGGGEVLQRYTALHSLLEAGAKDPETIIRTIFLMEGERGTKTETFIDQTIRLADDLERAYDDADLRGAYEDMSETVAELRSRPKGSLPPGLEAKLESIEGQMEMLGEMIEKNAVHELVWGLRMHKDEPDSFFTYIEGEMFLKMSAVVTSGMLAAAAIPTTGGLGTAAVSAVLMSAGGFITGEYIDSYLGLMDPKKRSGIMKVVDGDMDMTDYALDSLTQISTGAVWSFGLGQIGRVIGKWGRTVVQAGKGDQAFAKFCIAKALTTSADKFNEFNKLFTKLVPGSQKSAGKMIGDLIEENVEEFSQQIADSAAANIDKANTDGSLEGQLASSVLKALSLGLSILNGAKGTPGIDTKTIPGTELVSMKQSGDGTLETEFAYETDPVDVVAALEENGMFSAVSTLDDGTIQAVSKETGKVAMTLKPSPRLIAARQMSTDLATKAAQELQTAKNTQQRINAVSDLVAFMASPDAALLTNSDRVALGNILSQGLHDRALYPHEEQMLLAGHAVEGTVGKLTAEESQAKKKAMLTAMKDGLTAASEIENLDRSRAELEAEAKQIGALFLHAGLAGDSVAVLDPGTMEFQNVSFYGADGKPAVINDTGVARGTEASIDTKNGEIPALQKFFVSRDGGGMMKREFDIEHVEGNVYECDADAELMMLVGGLQAKGGTDLKMARDKVSAQVDGEEIIIQRRQQPKEPVAEIPRTGLEPAAGGTVVRPRGQDALATPLHASDAKGTRVLTDENSVDSSPADTDQKKQNETLTVQKEEMQEIVRSGAKKVPLRSLKPRTINQIMQTMYEKGIIQGDRDTEGNARPPEVFVRQVGQGGMGVTYLVTVRSYQGGGTAELSNPLSEALPILHEQSFILKQSNEIAAKNHPDLLKNEADSLMRLNDASHREAMKIVEEAAASQLERSAGDMKPEEARTMARKIARQLAKTVPLDVDRFVLAVERGADTESVQREIVTTFTPDADGNVRPPETKTVTFGGANPERMMRDVVADALRTHGNPAPEAIAAHQDFYAMGVAGQVDMKDFLENNPQLSQDAKLTVVYSQMQGVRSARLAGMQHNDVKNANTMAQFNTPVTVNEGRIEGLARRVGLRSNTGSMRAQVIDPGIADDIGPRPTDQVGKVKGTPDHMSPEQIRGDETYGTEDAYAMGTLLFKAVTGRDFRQEVVGNNETDILVSIMRISQMDADKVEKIVQRTVPDKRVQKALMGLLHPDYEKRWSIDEALSYMDKNVISQRKRKKAQPELVEAMQKFRGGQKLGPGRGKNIDLASPDTESSPMNREKKENASANKDSRQHQKSEENLAALEGEKVNVQNEVADNETMSRQEAREKLLEKAKRAAIRANIRLGDIDPSSSDIKAERQIAVEAVLDVMMSPDANVLTDADRVDLLEEAVGRTLQKHEVAMFLAGHRAKGVNPETGLPYESAYSGRLQPGQSMAKQRAMLNELDTHYLSDEQRAEALAIGNIALHAGLAGDAPVDPQSEPSPTPSRRPSALPHVDDRESTSEPPADFLAESNAMDDSQATMMDPLYAVTPRESISKTPDILDGRGAVDLANQAQEFVTPSGNKVIAGTDYGKNHEKYINNEDRVVVSPDGEMIAAVDGMGGHGNGDKAAQVVAEKLMQYPDDVPRAMHEAKIAIANQDEGTDGRGAVFSTVRVVEHDGHKFAVPLFTGDAGIIILSQDGIIKYRSKDNSELQKMMDVGMSRADAIEYPTAQYVLGPVTGKSEGKILNNPLKPGMMTNGMVPLKPGDRIITFTDGLSDQISDQGIAYFANPTIPLGQAMQNLSDVSGAQMEGNPVPNAPEGTLHPDTKPDNRGVAMMDIAE